ncbi:Uncharacterized protein Adt_47160 [Abeliophyllum distichum]|uniref:Ubiquitin-like protease family profile domain-containing protein n=1 Tax=Abeliophyllum distichum TaxID=126358 RepID=A0ABD1NVP4_9LAMI
MQREIQTSVAQVHGKFDEVMVVKPGGGGGGGGGGTVSGGDANPVVVDRGKKTLGSSSLSAADIPILCDINRRKESQYLDWVMRSKPTDYVRFASGAKWTKHNLQQIGTVGFPLEPKDMDNAMLLIRVRNEQYSDIFSKKHAILDTEFGVILRNFRAQTLDPSGQICQVRPLDYGAAIKQYISGLRPKVLGKKWTECEHLLWPYVIDNKFWVLFHLDLVEWKLIILDNNQYFIDDAKLHYHILPCMNIIPEMIQKHLPDFGRKKMKSLDYWRKPFVDLPQLQQPR